MPGQANQTVVRPPPRYSRNTRVKLWLHAVGCEITGGTVWSVELWDKTYRYWVEAPNIGRLLVFEHDLAPDSDEVEALSDVG